MEDWRGWQVDWYCPSHKDLDELVYFHCLCQFCNIVLSPLIVASLTLKLQYLPYQPSGMPTTERIIAPQTSHLYLTSFIFVFFNFVIVIIPDTIQWTNGDIGSGRYF